MGGANGIVACSDIVAAVDDTKFGFTEVKLGLAPATISPFVLDKMSLNFASELMLTGRLFSAKEAKAGQLINFLGTEDEVNNYISQTLKHFGQNGPEAVRETKKLMLGLKDLNPIELQSKTATVIAERRVSKEGQQGLDAFFTKTKAPWKL